MGELSWLPLCPSKAQQGVHAFLLGLGIEQTWTAPLSASRDLLSVTSNGIECGL